MNALRAFPIATTVSPPRQGRPGKRGLLRGARRQGAAAVEFALVAPLLFALVLGIVEFGRAFWVTETLQIAARTACRTASLPGTSDADVNQSVEQSMFNIRGQQTLVTINGRSASLSTARSGDVVGITVSVPFRDVSLLPSPWFLNSATLSGNAVMRKE
jgi:Flp pilus assembly protein TadG